MRLLHRGRRRLGRLLVPVAAWVLLVGSFAGLLAWTERRGRQELEQRFALRGAVAAAFTAAHVGDLITRERELARELLSGATVEERSFQRTVAAFGYEAAVLLDRRGRLLHVAPRAPGLVGQDLARRYDHLRRAVGGQAAVSRAVLSAARRRPVVAFAVPFPTPHGRRVFSGAYEIGRTPIATYLRNAVPIGSTALYLVDETGVVVAANQPLPDGLVALRGQDAALAAAAARRPEGSYRAAGTAWYYTTRPVAGTPWRLVATVPKPSLYRPVDGGGRWGPWLLLAAFALGGLVTVALAIQRLEARARRRRLEQELTQQRELYERLLLGLSALGEGVLLEERARIVFANDAFCRLSGYGREELLRLPPARVLPAPPADQATGRPPDGEDTAAVFEGDLRHRSGRALPVQVAAKLLGHAEGAQRLWVVHDISERRRWERQRAELLAQVQALARTDALTGVPNRRVWDEELPRELARARRSGQPLCVALLDLDRFKAYNDTHGHQAGDRLLKAAAAAWRAVVRATDLLARYGGEEFALLAPACTLEDARSLADRLRAAMPDGATVSIGVAAWDGQEPPEALVARADAALYQAKADGRDRCVTA